LIQKKSQLPSTRIFGLIILVILGVFSLVFFTLALILQNTDLIVSPDSFDQDQYLLLVVLYTLGSLFLLLILGLLFRPRVERESDKLQPPSTFSLAIDIQDPEAPKALLVSGLLTVFYFYVILFANYPSYLEPLDQSLIFLFTFTFGIVMIVFFYGFWRLALQKAPLRIWLFIPEQSSSNQLLARSTDRTRTFLPEEFSLGGEAGTKVSLRSSTWLAGRGQQPLNHRRVYTLYLVSSKYYLQISFPFHSVENMKSPYPEGFTLAKQEPSKPWGSKKFLCSAQVITGDLLDPRYEWFLATLRHLQQN